ncbi:MAG: 50S ribosomal protein L11 methyltransferase [Hyphomicrobiaceae bacterium]
MTVNNTTQTPPVTISLVFDDRGFARQVASTLQELMLPTPDALTLFENGPHSWRIDAYYTDTPNIDTLHKALSETVGRSIPAFEVADTPDENWVALSQAALPAVAAGRFTIYGSHDRHRVARGPNSILIDAGEAFGTAHHPTTLGCLRAIDRQVRRHTRNASAFQNCFDLGCGSGVLTIALARVLPDATFVASDLDQQSVVVAAQNMRANGSHRQISPIVAAGTAHPLVTKRAPFDLIVANILAGPLLELAPDIRRVVRRQGTLILSGLLVAQAPAVIAKYRAHDFHLVEHERIDGWSTLTLRNR